MTHVELVALVANQLSVSKVSVQTVLNTIVGAVSSALENEQSVHISGLGRFKVVSRPARTGRNPKTGVAVEISARKTTKFVPTKNLKKF